MLRQLLRFIGVGGAATLFMYALLVLLVEWLGMPATPASALAYLISALANYSANYHWTFASQNAHRSALPRFAVIAAAGLLLNTSIMYLCADRLDFHYMLAQIVASAVVLAWNFLANRHWTFQASGDTRP